MNEPDHVPEAAIQPVLGQLSRQERGLAAAALVAFLGITYVGPALTRLMTPKSRTQKLREAAAKKSRALRRRAGKARVRARRR